MKIKQSNPNTSPRNKIIFVGLLVAFALALLFANSDQERGKLEKNNRETTVTPASNSLPNLTIVLKREQYEKLKTKRNEAIGKDGIEPGAGILLSNDEDKVSANIWYEGEKLKSKVRLKGDWTQHLLGDTWSFRVELNKNQTINGMRKFSLQHPITRNYAGEWLFHELLKAEDILHLRYDFVNVNLKITGSLQEETKTLGVYALEEFFDKQLIEHNRRREGVILKFDEDPIWRERRRIMNQGMELAELGEFKLREVPNLDILPFGKKRILSDSVLYKQFLTGKYLLQSFVDKELNISQVFDVERLAMYNAICNILGANHALFNHNYRFYYNPISSRLEPIGFDSDPVKKVSFFLPFLNAFKDDEYSAAYMAALEKVSSDEYFEAFIESPALLEKVSLLQNAYPEYQFKNAYLQHNKTVLQTLLFPENSLSVYFEEKNNKSIRLSILNHNRYPVEVLGLSNLGGRRFGSSSEKVIIGPSGKEVVTFSLDENYEYLFIKKRKDKFKVKAELEDMQVEYKTVGTSVVLKGEILDWPLSNQEILETDIFRQKSNVHQYEFLKVDTLAKTIRCQKGHWQVSNLIIPKGFTFIVDAGTSFNFYSAFSNIVSFSSVQFLGTKEEPITFYSHVGGKGLLVLNCRDTSVINHTKFDKLSSALTTGWSVSGAVNFYEAPVKMNHCIFSNNNSEDALNIINSYFEIDNLIFQNTKSDAFDGDFVEGTIKNTLFRNIGNDAIDVSGSTINISNVHIVNAGDKGVSVGEKSTITAESMMVKESEIAVACKDQSTLTLSNVLLEKNKLAFTGFQKKSEYGFATIIADSIELKNNALDHLIEKKSVLQLNGKTVNTVNDVIERMYGAEFGKNSN